MEIQETTMTDFFANETPHPVFPDESHKPIKPDPDTPYQPTEPAEPDVQPEIIGDK